ncbi:MAG: SRPBCC family protein [Gaiellaceae bacterium]
MAVNARSTRVTLPAEAQILVVREFDAPRRLVWRAATEPELVRRWWHGNRGEMTVCEIDLRVGGRWRYAMRKPDGAEVAFHGEYLAIAPQEQIVSRDVFEGLPADVSEEDAATVNTVSFSEEDGRTIYTLLIQAANGESRDAIIASGMESGLHEVFDLLEATARTLT